MKKVGSRLAMAAAALLMSVGVQAGVLRTTITFDPVDTSTLIYGDFGVLVHNDEFYQPGLGGRTMWFDPFSNAAGAQTGDLVGAILNGPCADLLCPANNDTNYIGMLDDAVLVFGSTDGFRFSVKSLSAAFLGSGDPLQYMPGFLRLQGVRDGMSTTATFALTGLDANGQLNFNTINTGNFGNIEFDYVYAFGLACPAPGGGSTCSGFTTNRAQFALDNIVIEHVPEPGSLALLAVAGLAAGRVTRRRRAA
ncbi:MAG: NF038120 family PEP-CTERM protein [Roseateles sp.]|uniref:NF038120 family PEP-CTERM protein n=1 Tax=Roseateles sp. TaxID=1971397 RepID=UPI0039E7C8A4